MLNGCTMLLTEADKQEGYVKLSNDDRAWLQQILQSWWHDVRGMVAEFGTHRTWGLMTETNEKQREDIERILQIDLE